MPPRVVKRGGGAKRGGRATRSSLKAQDQTPPEVPGSPAEIEDVPAPEAIEEVKVEAQPIAEEKSPLPVVEEKPIVAVSDEVSEMKSEPKESNGFTKEEKMKESVEDYERDERLDLEDNDPEYETEEYAGVDYDEKEVDPEEDVDEMVEEEEEEEEEEDNLVEEDEEEEEELVVDVQEHSEGAREQRERVEADEDEHHKVVKERRKRKEFEVFVGGLDKEATESDLRKAFDGIGEVTEVRLMMNPQTKKNKGFAFLRFATVEQAKRAVAELKDLVIHGKQCGVKPSQDSDTLFLGNICKSWTTEALKEKLKHYRVENVEDVTLVEDSINDGMNRGFAFLEFSSRSDAMEAFKLLQKRDVVFGIDKPAKVSFADSFIDPGDEIMAQVKTVFLDGIPASWDEDRVRGLLKKHGDIKKVELARNMASAKRKDFGFVTFGSHSAAVVCAKSINNTDLGDGDTKAKVRARLSRPLQKSRGKHVGRGDFRPSHNSGRVSRGSWSHHSPRSVPVLGVRRAGNRAPPPSMKRPVGFRDRRPPISVPSRSRPVAPPTRSYIRRAPVSSHPKSSLKREYSRREDLPPPRSRPVADYGHRVVQERRLPYREEYVPRGSGYSDPPPRNTSRPTSRRAYVDDEYVQRFERPPPPPPPHPSYREGRGRVYDPVVGSKRPYMDDIPPRSVDVSVRQSRARLEYDYGGNASHYVDAYGERVGRPNLGYGTNGRTSQDSRGMYSSRHNPSYGGSSYDDVNGMYSSSYGGEYVSRGADVGGGGGYSSMYSSRGMGGSSYMSSGGSGSYY